MFKSVDATVGELATQGGEAEMKRNDIQSALQTAHPILTDAGLKQVIFLVNFNAWHEGYDQ
jgi:hypothetical protein